MGKTFIEHDFNLPYHGNELSDAENKIEKIKIKLIEINIKKTIDDDIHVTMFEQIVHILDYVGNLSIPAFEIQDELEEMYKIKFLMSPEIARQLWLDHYGEIHKPYNILKNRCYRLLDMLDKEYIRKYKKTPPNYKI